jgi:GH24 family phage-related lysozyme (muramidase)
MKTGIKGIKLIKSFEGCRTEAYDDLQPKVKLTAKTKIKGKLTIGYGHTGTVDGIPIKCGTKITMAKAVDLLKEDLTKFEKKVNKYSKKYNWTQNEFDAMVSFAYNHGTISDLTAFGTRSKLTISKKMLLYNKSKGKVLDGLNTRREAEQALFYS